MADLTGRNADETVPDIATWGSGNVLETGEGTVKVDLDGKASLSGGSDADFDAMPQVNGDDIIERDSNSDGEFVRNSDGTAYARLFVTHPEIDFEAGGLFRTGTFTVDLPITMINISVGGTGPGSVANFVIGRAEAGATDTVDLRVCRFLGSSSGSSDINVDITGRWK